MAQTINNDGDFWIRAMSTVAVFVWSVDVPRESVTKPNEAETRHKAAPRRPWTSGITDAVIQEIVLGVKMAQTTQRFT